MQITRIKSFVVGMPGHNVILVKIETDEEPYGIGEANDDALCDLALERVQQGYTALRIVPTLFDVEPWDSRRSVRASVRTVARLREAVGEDIDLLVDIHHRFSPMENVHFGRGPRHRSGAAQSNLACLRRGLRPPRRLGAEFRDSRGDPPAQLDA